MASVSGIPAPGGLIQDQEAGVPDERPGNLQALTLAAREVSGSLGDDRVVTAPPLQQVAMDRRTQAGLDQPLLLISSSQRVKLSRTVPWNMAIRSSTIATEFTKSSRGISAMGLPS